MPLNKIEKEKEEESIDIYEVSSLACKKFAKCEESRDGVTWPHAIYVHIRYLGVNYPIG